MQQATFEHLGRRLRDARLDRKLELADIAGSLHIRPRYLEALEDGALEHLPGGDAFVTGYLNRYARHLGLNAGELVAEYQRMGGLPQRRLFQLPDRMRKQQHPSQLMVLLSFAAACLLSIGWMRAHPPLGGAGGIHPPRIAAARAAIRAPSCLKPSAPLWPPCYYQVIDAGFGVMTHRPSRSIMELR